MNDSLKKNQTKSFGALVFILVAFVLTILSMFIYTLYKTYQKKYEFLNEDLIINNLEMETVPINAYTLMDYNDKEEKDD